MHLKPYLGLVVASLLVLGANRAPAQAPPAASVARVPLAIGAGFSGYNPDYRNGNLLGGMLWIDYSPSWVPSLLRGVGLEVEAHDLHFGQSSSAAEESSAGRCLGRVFYSWPRYSGIRPYVNYQMGLGNQDYTVGPLAAPVRIHQSRTVTSVGGGVEFRASAGGSGCAPITAPSSGPISSSMAPGPSRNSMRGLHHRRFISLQRAPSSLRAGWAARHAQNDHRVCADVLGIGGGFALAVVTGSAGLVGSEAVSFFANLGFEVVGIENDMRSRFFGQEPPRAGIRSASRKSWALPTARRTLTFAIGNR